MARYIGRVVDVREGDGRHGDGHLLEGRLGLALDDGSGVRLVRHAAGVAGLLDAVVHGVVRVDDRLVRLRGGVGIGRLVGIGRIRRVDGVNGIHRIDRIHGIHWIRGIDRIHRVNRIDRIDRIDRINRIDRVNRVDWVNRVNRIDGVNRVDRINRIRRVNGVGRINRIRRVSRICGISGIRRIRRILRIGRLSPILAIRHVSLCLLLRSRLGPLLRFFGRGRLLGDRLVVQRLNLESVKLSRREIELIRMGLHDLDSGFVELSSIEPTERLVVTLGQRPPFSRGSETIAAVLGVAGGVGCGHAAHRGNDQRRSSEKRYCLPR